VLAALVFQKGNIGQLAGPAGADTGPVVVHA